MRHEGMIPLASATSVPRQGLPAVALLLAALIAICWICRDGIAQMLHVWATRPHYLHAFATLPLLAWLIHRRRAEMEWAHWHGSWTGLLVAASGLALDHAGRLGSVFTLQQLGWVLALVGTALVFLGTRAWRVLWLPGAMLLTLVPLPAFLFAHLISGLESISSFMAVRGLHALGIPSFYDAGAIDVGRSRLGTAELRAGLGFVIPLATVAVVLAALVRARCWRRVALPVLVVVTVVVANALLTLVAGVLADREAMATMQAIVDSKVALVPGMALAGWACCTALLFRPIKPRLAGAGRWPAAAGIREATRIGGRRVSVHLLVAMLVGVIVARTFGASSVSIPTRSRLVDFPMQIGDWRGERSLLEPFEADALQLDDYVLARYRRPGAAPLSFYVAWYDSQQAGRSVHSPNSCLPGQGWKIRELESVTVDRVEWHGQPLRVNRAVIELAGQRQLLYYWFQQRGHVMTSEYVVKWRLFQDSLLSGRSDGALVRLVVPLGSDVDARSADSTAQGFLALAVPKLPPFVPE